jgi:hypothetical protein
MSSALHTILAKQVFGMAFQGSRLWGPRSPFAESKGPDTYNSASAIYIAQAFVVILKPVMPGMPTSVMVSSAYTAK